MNSFSHMTASNNDVSPISSLKDAVSTSRTATIDPTDVTGSGLNEVSWQTWLIIVLLLTLLGFNIFVYLAKGTDLAANLFDTLILPFLRLFGYTSLETTKQVIQTSGAGAKAGIDIVTDTTTGGIDGIIAGTQSQTQTKHSSSGTTPVGQTAQTSQGGVPVQQQIQQAGSSMEWQQDTLEQALSSASQNAPPNGASGNVEAATTGQAGWCYIGDDRGIRTCGEVGVNDMCMSGDVFPTQDVCVNPNLRV